MMSCYSMLMITICNSHIFNNILGLSTNHQDWLIRYLNIIYLNYVFFLVILLCSKKSSQILTRLDGRISACTFVFLFHFLYKHKGFLTSCWRIFLSISNNKYEINGINSDINTCVNKHINEFEYTNEATSFTQIYRLGPFLLILGDLQHTKAYNAILIHFWVYFIRRYLIN